MRTLETGRFPGQLTNASFAFSVAGPNPLIMLLLWVVEVLTPRYWEDISCCPRWGGGGGEMGVPGGPDAC